MPSPIRRSARGQPPGAPSTTSSLSSRQDRNGRAISNQKSGTPRSLSSEEASEPPVARRSQRQPAQKEEPSARDADVAEDNDDDGAEEEEITRCICGHQEYPGPPLSEAFAGIPDAQSEDAGGLFILCDGCSVWQHGGCVGIVEESQSPDKYFCEECHPKKHAVHTDSRGQKYSLYLPLHPKAQPRKSSMSKSEKEAKKERDAAAARASVDPSTGKRRGTMRSKEHDDEEEQLRKAIEESKREVDGVVVVGRRHGKRGRDDSSEDSSSKQDIKRQRRASESMPSVAATASIEDDSEDGNAPASRAKKAKAEAAMSARQAEQKEKDLERDKARAEAAGRRLERARSRRNDEADAVEETTPIPTDAGRTTPPALSSQPPSPPPAEKAPIRRGPGKKPPKKLGNNQYTKRRFEEAVAATSPHGRKRPINPSGSGDDASEIVVNGDTGTATSKLSPGPSAPTENGAGPGKAKFGRGRKAAMANGNGIRAPGEEVEKTFTNMHRALVNMSTYVSRQQDEMTSTGPGGEKSPVGSTGGALTMLIGGAVPSASASALSDSSAGDRKFDELSCAEMALELQKGIVEWQRQWGHLASA